MSDGPARGDASLPLESVDAASLTGLLRRAGYAGAEVTGFTREPVAGTSHGGGDLHRYRLIVRSASGVPEQVPPAALVLKESRGIGSQSLDPDYPSREADCYRHDLFSGLGERLRVPRAFEVDVDAGAQRYWIWMEDLGDAFDVEWTPELLTQAVRDLAELHARWWGRGHELSRMAFLRQRAQAMYDGLWSERIARNCAAIEGHEHEREISRVFTNDRRRLLMRLSRAADIVYLKLDALPQTLLHHDVWLPNLGRVDGKTALIDWSYAGPGTPGADLSQTVALMIQVWGPDMDDEALLAALHSGLTSDWGLDVPYSDVLAGYELCFCLRPAHALGGPVLGGILSGKATMVGSDSLDERLAAADATLRRIERGVRRRASGGWAGHAMGGGLRSRLAYNFRIYA